MVSSVIASMVGGSGVDETSVIVVGADVGESGVLDILAINYYRM